MKLHRKIRQLFCRHINCEVGLSLDGPAPGWRWLCWSCGKSRSLEK